MKRIYTIVLLTVLAFSATAQDTIIFRNGDEQRVKVTEVSNVQIKYKLWNNQNGPVYTKNTRDIFMIKYEGGNKEVFSQSQTSVPETHQSYSSDSDMEVTRGELELNGRKLNDIDVKSLLGMAGYETWASAQSQRRAGNNLITWGWIDAIVGSLLYIVDVNTRFSLNGNGVLYGMILVGLSQVELPLGYVLRGAGNGRLNWLASQYNKNGAMSQNLSVSFGPSLVSAPSATGNTYGLGAGIQLNF